MFFSVPLTETTQIF